MELVQPIIRQCLVMFLYMGAGYALYKGKKITDQGSRCLATLLLWLVLPTVLIKSFCVSPIAEKVLHLALSSAVGAGTLGICILVARLLFGKAPVDRFAATFSNAGFIGIPLVQAALGSEAVFYIVGMIALLNILQWTYGVSFLTGGRVRCTAKTVLLNPITISVLTGIILFFTGLGARLPGVVFSSLEGIAAMNAPLAMLILGTYLAQADIKSMLLTPRLYVVSAVRLIVIPLLLVALLKWLPIPALIKTAVLIAASAPVGSNVAVYAQLHNLDYVYASKTVVLSTMLSILTLPVIMLLL